MPVLEGISWKASASKHLEAFVLLEQVLFALLQVCHDVKNGGEDHVVICERRQGDCREQHASAFLLIRFLHQQRLVLGRPNRMDNVAKIFS